MNAIMLMNPAIYQALGLENKNSLLSHSSMEGEDSFEDALASFVQNNNLSDEKTVEQTNIESEKREFAKEFHHLIANVDMEFIIKNLSNLLVELPEEDVFLTTETLSDESILMLFQELPVEWVQELKGLFEKSKSMEGLLENVEETGDPISLLAMLSAFSVKDVQVFAGNEAKVIQALQPLVSTYFPYASEKENLTSFREIIMQIREFFKNTDTSLANSKQMVMNASHEAKPNQVARMAELVYMNQLANHKGEKTSSNIQSHQPVLFDTTNSHMARLQQFMLHTGESQATRPNQEQFVRQFENLLARSTFQQLGNGIQQLNVKLHPASLGRLDITIQQVNGMLVARLMTTTTLARDLIEGQLQHLRNAFHGQNIQVDKIEITHQHNQQLFKDSTNEHSRREHEKNQSEQPFEDDEEQETLDFSEFLEETVNLEV